MKCCGKIVIVLSYEKRKKLIQCKQQKQIKKKILREKKNNEIITIFFSIPYLIQFCKRSIKEKYHHLHLKKNLPKLNKFFHIS